MGDANPFAQLVRATLVAYVVEPRLFRDVAVSGQARHAESDRNPVSGLRARCATTREAPMGQRFLDGTLPTGGASDGVANELYVHRSTKARAR